MTSELLSAEWAAHPPLHGVYTTVGTMRGAGYGAGNLALHVGDNGAHVLRNRAALTSRLDLDRIVFLEQVHGTDVFEAGPQASEIVPRADAVWTSARRIGCAVLTADCLPVMIGDRAGGCIGVAHCGWRGLSMGILATLIRAMPAPTRNLVAHLGPGIGAARYEVGRDVVDAFIGQDAGAAACFRPGVGANKWYADLEMLARRQLRGLGVRQIDGGGFCTARDSRFYSFRRAATTGRFASVVWID